MSDLPPDNLTAPELYFPNTMCSAIADSIDDLLQLPNKSVLRSLRTEDPSPIVGVFSDNWVPDTESFEIGQTGPTIGKYLIRVQNKFIGLDEPASRAAFTAIAKSIRVILYRDESLAVALHGLSETLLGSVESVDKFDVVRQEYLSSRIGTSFTYLATTYVMVQTNTSIL